MTIPTSITTALSSLETQVASATPLANAGNATITALQLNTANLVASIQSTLTLPSQLDSWTSTSDPAQMIVGVLDLSVVADDQANLSLMRGVVGRAASNLDQL